MLPLKQRVLRDLSRLASDTIYGRGFSRHLLDEDVLLLLSIAHTPLETDLSQRQRFGVVWAKYEHEVAAHETILQLHQHIERGISLSVRFELGVDELGKPIVPRTSHNTIIRHVLYKGKPLFALSTATTTEGSTAETGSIEPTRIYCFPCKCNSTAVRRREQQNNHFPAVNFTSKSIILNNELEVPFPSGLYMTRLISWTHRLDDGDVLLRLLTNTTLVVSEQNKYAKEISEAMAMVDAVERLVKLVYSQSMQDLAQSFAAVHVYVLGDGKYPLCAAALCLSMPSTCSFHSVDPILVPVDVSGSIYQDRFHQYSIMSQDMDLAVVNEMSLTKSTLSIVVACHSHAPLQEFWDRVSTAKIAVAMPCCADYANLVGTARLVTEFDDFEVYSAKRRIKLYSSE
jgi:hypothetical protein